MKRTGCWRRDCGRLAALGRGGGAIGLAAAALLAVLAGCATIGHDFPVDRVSDITIGKTTQDEVHLIFGDPWRVGIEDGERTWTYGKYRYRLFGDASTTDLVVRFNARGVVSSYSFNTTEHQQ